MTILKRTHLSSGLRASSKGGDFNEATFDGTERSPFQFQARRKGSRAQLCDRDARRLPSVKRWRAITLSRSGSVRTGPSLSAPLTAHFASSISRADSASGADSHMQPNGRFAASTKLNAMMKTASLRSRIPMSTYRATGPFSIRTSRNSSDRLGNVGVRNAYASVISALVNMGRRLSGPTTTRSYSVTVHMICPCCGRTNTATESIEVPTLRPNGAGASSRSAM